MTVGVHYQRPAWLTRNVLDRAIARLTRIGLSLWGARVLRVRGRSSGALRSTPVNVLTLDGERYLVAPRGHTDWVRNLRAAVAGDGVGPDSTDGQLLAIASRHPIFRIETLNR